MRWLNSKLTIVVRWTLKKLRWKDTESNQRQVSALLGLTLSYIIMLLLYWLH